MVTIEVDQEVFDFLQTKAIPFVDTPNTVLRKLLFSEGKTSKKKIKPMVAQTDHFWGMGAEAFDNAILKKEFNEDFTVCSPYRTMYESDKTIIYFQNFNQKGLNLWFRIKQKAFLTLSSSLKTSYICFTNPPTNTYFLIPVKNIEKKVEEARWRREDLEVNLDFNSSKWRELSWSLFDFRKVLNKKTE